MGDLAVLDMPSCFQHFEPPQALFIDGGLRHGVLHGFFNAGVGRSNQLDHFLGVFPHGIGSGDGGTEKYYPAGAFGGVLELLLGLSICRPLPPAAAKPVRHLLRHLLAKT